MVIAVIVGALTLSGVVVGGRLIAGDVNYARPPRVEENLDSDAPSDSWAGGAARQWSTTIDAGASVFTTPDHLFSVKTGDDPQTSTLTAYTMNGSGVTQAWTAAVDTSADSVAVSGAEDNPIYPSFLLWTKNTLIHGRTLYDITTGATSDAPWPADAVPVVVKDEGVVVACQQTTCAGYREGAAEPAWSSTVHDAVPGSPAQTDAAARITKMVDPNYTNAVSLADAKYVIIAYHYVINIDTGQVVDFSVPDNPPGVYSIGHTDEGWSIASTYFDVAAKSPTQWHLSFYGPAGGEPTSTQDTPDPPDTTYPLYYPRTPTKDDHRRMFLHHDYSTLAGSVTAAEENKKLCVQKIEMSNGTTIDVTGLDKNAFPCLEREATKVSTNGDVVMVGMRQVTNAVPFSLMYNAATGEQIAFEGMDPASGATFTVAAPKQIIGYSPTDGTLTGYTPTSSQ
ncbi:hypothetical protein AIF0345_3104 [Actinomyces israelii]|nr:hypothetical protein AIF0345_3104 [Actinomyces israelii]